MAESELKIALQREGEAQVSAFWERAEEAVAASRKEFEVELSQLQAETDQKLQTESASLRNSMLFEAQSRAMEFRLITETAVAERLLNLFGETLKGLTHDDRSNIWQALCEELPASDWKTVKVHPDNQPLAAETFPTAEIESDLTLDGGLIVTNKEGTIRIDNSLGCRLQRAWPDLLPQLLDELRKQVDNDETP